MFLRSIFALLLITMCHNLLADDIILYNGKIFTSEESNLYVEALAIQGERIVGTGTSEEMLARASENTQKVNLNGRLVIPGINDAHTHSFATPEHAVLNIPNFIPGPGPGVQEFIDMLTTKVAEVPKGKWIFGTVGTKFFDDPQATRFTLDTISPDHPVFLITWGGHGALLNTKGLQEAGISETESDPIGGYYERVSGTNTVNGRLQEYTIWLLRRYFKSLVSDEQAREHYTKFAQDMAGMGVTTIQDMDIGYTREDSERILDGLNLPINWRALCFPMSPEEACDSLLPGRIYNGPNEHLNMSGTKFILDGSPIERLAATRDEYSDLPGWSGFFSFQGSFAEIISLAKQGDPVQNQLILHSVGDLTTDYILAEIAAQGTPEFWKTRRVRIEHGALLWPDQLQKMKEYGIVFVHNPIFTAASDLIHDRYGANRALYYQPVRTALETGVSVGFGSDTAQVASNPYLEMMLQTLHLTNPGEALPVEQSIISYTYGSAYSEFTEHEKGLLKTGFKADLAVLSQDITSIPFYQLPTTTSLLTIVNGKIVHNTEQVSID